MTRRERRAARIGGVLVGIVIVAAIASLAIHGSPQVTFRDANSTVPADLSWAVLSSCSSPDEMGTFSSETVTLTDGRMTVQLTPVSGREEESALAERFTNECLAGYSFPDELPGTAPRFPSAAERLVTYDVAQRWLLPCLAAHRQLPQRIPTVEGYLGVDRATATPWLNFYDYFGQDGLDSLLAAREDCGSPSAPFAWAGG
ncbi:hypothetical protein [Protaetiibacter mangrovi]|uniref:Uncharacterized protein n=1 Tax=Protaetiibacter mangrovi TaxID=2970926 RepID=A0ABT1ZEZ8_9MICO|nr:hypothetical protein [Protaetiibacter mangrovi]MCS0499288.1 hypothetical protein [Protaetiibacter mangrovi]TPX03291.1 hypothetical protein FJ656_17960 [Schumannella luteola]